MYDRFSFNEIYQKKNRPLVLDGAVGSYLQSEIKSESSPLWSSELNFTHSEEVIKLHKKYINAGAEIITTNTFRTNPLAIKESSKQNQDFNLVNHSVKLALEARDDKDVLIAGSNAPAEDCYQTARTISKNELMDNHYSHIEQLWSYGVDFILNETMSHFDEIEIVSKYCFENKVPYIVSLYLNEKLKLLSGEDLFETLKFISDYSPIAIGINCIAPSLFQKIDLSKMTKTKFGFYLNCGSGNVTDEIITCGISPGEYVEEIKKYKDYNPVFIGSCCGSSPEHTKAIRKYVDEVYSN